MSKAINMHDAKTHLSRLVERAAQGEEIVIAKAGKPMARLGPLENAPRPKKFGLLEGRFTVPDDFDAPLDSRVLALFQGS
ncbi:MAG: type II toxin-antitoxin system Phd/YefM family antitoxin [Pseudomonadota bacterium]